jgi:hypothetical protein
VRAGVLLVTEFAFNCGKYAENVSERWVAKLAIDLPSRFPHDSPLTHSVLIESVRYHMRSYFSRHAVKFLLPLCLKPLHAAILSMLSREATADANGPDGLEPVRVM